MLKSRVLFSIAVIGLFCSVTLVQAAELVPALQAESTKTQVNASKKPYRELKKPAEIHTKANQIDVVEVFWYGCPPCYKMDPQIRQWREKKSDQIAFRLLPAVVIEEDKNFDAQVFLTLVAINALEQGHPIYFSALHAEKEGKPINQAELRSYETVASLLADKAGIDKQQFLSAWDSEAVKQGLDNIKDLIIKEYQLRVVPSFIVQGKYVIDERTIKDTSYNTVLEALDAVVKQVAVEQGRKP